MVNKLNTGQHRSTEHHCWLGEGVAMFTKHTCDVHGRCRAGKESGFPTERLKKILCHLICTGTYNTHALGSTSCAYSLADRATWTGSHRP